MSVCDWINFSVTVIVCIAVILATAAIWPLPRYPRVPRGKPIELSSLAVARALRKRRK